MSNARHLLKIGLVADLIEAYEFTIYAYLIDILRHVFFNVDDAISGLIESFAIFAIGYLTRPLGSLFFGMIGDRVGRGTALKISLAMSAVPTALMGLLPTYQEVGLLAPALLLALRLLQSFGMGGEMPVTACYIFESSPTDRRGVLCSVVPASSTAGILLASFIAFLLFRVFDHQTLLSWAWRIPFLLSIPMSIYISAMRRIIEDLPVPQYSRSSLSSGFLPMIKATLLASSLTVGGFTLGIYTPFYLIHFLNYPAHLARFTNVLAIAATAFFYLAAGALSRLIGYRRIIQVGLVMTIVLIVPLWLGLQTASFSMILAMQLLFALLLGLVGGVRMEASAEQFPTSMRCLGMNLSNVFPIIFFGGTTPLIYTWIIAKMDWLMFPAFYILFFNLLALPAGLSLQTHASK